MTEEKYIQEEEPYNADDRVQVNNARKKAKREKGERDVVIQSVMSVKEGRKWIHHILSMGDMFGNPHVRGDPYDTAFNCGMANLAHLIWMEIEAAAPEEVTKMRKEAQKYEKE